MLKKMFFLIPLLLSLVLFAASDNKDSDGTNKIKPIRNDPIKIENTIELKNTVQTQNVYAVDTEIYKEIEYAKRLYNSGDHVKAKTILSILKKDKDRSLSEKAHYLCLKLYNNLFIPIDAMEDTKYVVDAKELDKFKSKFPRSIYTNELENVFRNDLKIFNLNVLNPKNLTRIDLNDSSLVRYKNDSTYVCSFHGKYISKDKKEHDIIIKISGKINKYEPMGNMNDEFGSKGLLIDDDSTISIKVDNEEKIVIKDYVEFQQQPQYELREVEKYGSKVVKRFVREVNAENITQLATYLDNDLIIPNFKVQFIYGKMNELIPQDQANPQNLNERFNSKCIVEFKLDELKR
ncbi:MAG: hypothetical protein GQ534_01875 [Candidatus Delongbacteria bacterium]|nr:hypothetical protein [Candidatus Delongbacteria bacterium]